MHNYRELHVWKEALDLVELVYTVTASFPHTERFGLLTQMRRAAVSIPSNIAEGAARGTDREFTRFLRIARGSAGELETQTIVAQRIGLGHQDRLGMVNEATPRIMRMISGLITTVDS